MIKEIIFDCFGVLTQDGWTKFMKLYSNDESRQELSDLNHAADAGVLDFNEFFDRVSAVAGVPKSEVVSVLVKSYYPEPDVFELIAELKKNYKIGLISNINSPIEDYLPKELIDGLFDEQTLSYQTKFIKPAKEIFQIHLAKTGSAPNEAVFIDDREVNAEGAKSVGICGIWYRNIDQLKTELINLGIKI